MQSHYFTNQKVGHCCLHRLSLYQNSIDQQILFYYTRIIQYASRLSSYLLQQAGASADWVNRAKTLDKQTSTSRKRKISVFVIQLYYGPIGNTSNQIYPKEGPVEILRWSGEVFKDCIKLTDI